MSMNIENPGQYQHAEQGGAQKKRLRVYQQWQGNERFFCGGYLIGGPNWKASIGTAVLMLSPTIVYLVLVAWYLGRRVHVILFVVSCILPALSLLWLGITACKDPGIIPRQEPDQEYLMGNKPRTREVMINGQRVLLRYNDTCHFYQPPRAHHCSVNDNCIERFDHHCPWVGTTIGKRNYRTFLLFVYTTTVMCLYVFGVCLATLFAKHKELSDAAKAGGQPNPDVWPKALSTKESIASLVLMAYTFLFFWFVGGLSGFHAYLVATNQTTYENFRYNNSNQTNPYNRGIFANCYEVWCAPIPASRIHFRALAEEWKPPTGQPQSPYCEHIPAGNEYMEDVPAPPMQQDFSEPHSIHMPMGSAANSAADPAAMAPYSNEPYNGQYNASRQQGHYIQYGSKNAAMNAGLQYNSGAQYSPTMEHAEEQYGQYAPGQAQGVQYGRSAQYQGEPGPLAAEYDPHDDYGEQHMDEYAHADTQYYMPPHGQHVLPADGMAPTSPSSYSSAASPGAMAAAAAGGGQQGWGQAASLNKQGGLNTLYSAHPQEMPAYNAKYRA